MMMARLQRHAALRRVAPVALMPAAALAVHQLRYWLTFGGHAGLELQRQGHSYLHSLVPWIVLLMAIALGAFLQALGRALGGNRSATRFTASFAALWLLCTAALLAIYVSQEFLEGLFATGHPAGLASVLQYGGWWALPAALAVGLVLAAVFHGARWVLREVADRQARTVRNTAPALGPVAAPGVLTVRRRAPLVDGWSGRGPPN